MIPPIRDQFRDCFAHQLMMGFVGKRTNVQKTRQGEERIGWQ